MKHEVCKDLTSCFPGFASGDVLKNNMLMPFPAGNLKPQGWLKHQLSKIADGLAGHLYEFSGFLKPDNGWLSPENGIGWEEQPYWLRGFVKLAIELEDERCLSVAKNWFEKMLEGAQEDGWYGPRCLKNASFSDHRIVTDIWGHMVMNEAIMTWYEYTQDERFLKLLINFLRFCSSLPEDRLIPVSLAPDVPWQYSIQLARSCDIIPVIFRCYELTGESFLPELAKRIFLRRQNDPAAMFISRHTVHFAQMFAYETVYSRLSKNPAHRSSAEYWYGLHYSEWGQMPRGAFAADENFRKGCMDPRYGTESCTWFELVRSHLLLGAIDGETIYGDRIEDVLFNHYPASYSPDWKKLHYITACNQVSLDASTDHNYCNAPPQIAYSDVRYRCCRHNAATAFPIFTEHLTMKTPDNGLAFFLYAPHSGKTEGVSWIMDTKYPFREKVVIQLESERNTPFPVFFRIPGWCKMFSVKINGKTCGKTAASGAWFHLPAVKRGSFRIEIQMKAECGYAFYPRTGAISVERGPLTYSLALKEDYRETPDSCYPDNPYTEVTTQTAWNYGIDCSVSPQYSVLPFKNDCFFSENAPAQIVLTGRKIPEWTLQDNQPAPLQHGPAYSGEPAEKLRLIPLGCARLRLSVFPQVTDNPCSVHWEKTETETKRENRPDAYSVQ